MKKFIKLLAAALAVTALAGCSLVTVNTEKIVVATVGDQQITKAEFDQQFNSFLSQFGYTQESEEIAEQLKDLKQNYIDSMVENLVLENKIKELGFDTVTDAEKAEAEQRVQDWYDEQYAMLLEQFKADESVENPEEKAASTIEDYLDQYGITLEDMKEEEIAAVSTQKLYDHVTGEVTVTEEEAKLEFAQKAKADKETYEKDLASFISAYESGRTLYYTPEGAFFVKHILIGLTDEQKKEITDLRADDDEAVAATADAKREEYLLTIKEKADTVLGLVNDGGDFDALMEEYGEDPGMKNENYKDGYLTYAGDTGFVAEFAKACEGLTADGMTTGLVGTDFGYHIIRRVDTLPAGEAKFEDVKDALMEAMLNDKKSQKYDEQVDAWISEANVDIKSNNL